MDHTRRSLLTAALALSAAVAVGQEVTVRSVEVEADNYEPLYMWKGVATVGTRSRLAVGADGRAYLLYSMAGNVNNPAFMSLGTIQDGRVSVRGLSTIDQVARVAAWPFDLGLDAQGDLYVLSRWKRGRGGFTLWRRSEEGWHAETVGVGKVFRDSPLAMALRPDGSVDVVTVGAVDEAPDWRYSSQLAVWTRQPNGEWLERRPEALKDAANSDFDAVTLGDGRLAVVFRPAAGGPIGGVRGSDGAWSVEKLPALQRCGFIVAEAGADGELTAAFAGDSDGKGLSTVILARRSAEGKWNQQVLATAPEGRRVGRTDLDVAGDAVAVVWDAVPRAKTDDAGEVMLSLVRGQTVATHKLADNCGQPSLALLPGGRQAWVGVQTGGRDGQDFRLLSVGIGSPAAAVTLDISPEAKRRAEAAAAMLHSGDSPLQREALQEVATHKLKGFGLEAWAFFGAHDDPKDKALAMRALGESGAPQTAEAVGVALDDKSPALIEAAMAYLGAYGPKPNALRLLSDIIQRRDFGFMDERARAARGIASLAASPRGAADPAFQELLVRALTQAPQDVRRLTAQALRSSNALASQSVPLAGAVGRAAEAMLANLTSADRTTRFIAREQLVMLIGTPVVGAAVERAYAGDDFYRRARTAKVLARARKPFDCLKLRAVFERGSEAAQSEAIEALDYAWPDGAEAVLGHALKHGRPWAKVKAVFALRAIGGMFERPANSAESGPPIAPPQRQRAAAEALMIGLDDADPEVLYRAIDALGALRHAPARSRIASLAAGKAPLDPRVARSIRTALARLGDPIRLGGRRMLLLDDFAVERMTGVVRSVRPARKHPANPVIKGTKPWEFQNVYFYGAVIYDEQEQLFKAWYKANTHKSPADAKNPGYQIRILYATSTDGVEWHKPDLGIDPLHNGRNNIVWNNVDMMSVWKDLREPDPGRRYKAVYYDRAGDTKAMGVADMDDLSREDKLRVDHELARRYGHTGYGFATSPDGLRWTPCPDNPVIRGQSWRDGPTSDVMNGCWDDFAGVFRLYCKTMSDERSVAYAETQDGLRWVTPEVILPAPKFIRLPDGTKTRNRAVHYGMGVTPYQGMYVGLLWVFRTYDDWTVDVVLAASRDGVSWQRCSDPTPLIERAGSFKAWDGGQVYSASHFLVRDDEIYVYYAGGDGFHNRANSMGCGLATLKLDRFAAIHPARDNGTLTTRPLIFDGSKLRLNVRAPAGSVTVELLDAGGTVVPGFEAARCRPVRGDDLAAEVRWENADLKTQAGKPVRLRFHLQGEADLYSFEVN